jgi:hypothetical protein
MGACRAEINAVQDGMHVQFMSYCIDARYFLVDDSFCTCNYMWCMYVWLIFGRLRQ